MKELNLCLSAGGKRAQLDTVANVPTPEPFRRWHPIPHIGLHESVVRSVERLGLTIVAQTHALSRGKHRPDDRYFGMYQISTENPEMGLVLATRNSHDKEFVAGLAAGEGVFACDNLSFWGEVVLGRIHTTHILRDLPGLCDRAVSMLAENWNGAEKRVAAYKAHGLADERAHDFLIRSVDAGVIPISTAPRVLGEWRKPSHDEFAQDGKTAWRLFNAYTEAFKTLGNPATLMRRSQILHGMMSAECGILGKEEVARN